MIESDEKVTSARTVGVLIFGNQIKKKLNLLDYHNGKQSIPVDKIKYEFDVDASFAPNAHSRSGTRCRVFRVFPRLNSRKCVRGPTTKINFVWRFAKMSHVWPMLVVPSKIGTNLVPHFILCQRNDDPIEIFVLQ